jgi:uncharacterized membrane protein
MRNFPKHWLVAFSGASLSLGISSYFHYDNVKANAILTFLGVFLVYNRYLLVERNRPLFIKMVFVLFMVLTLVFAVKIAGSIVAFLLLLVSGIIGISYSYKLNKWQYTIRDIPFLKMGVVVLVWTFICCVFPWLNTKENVPFSPFLLLHGIYIFAIALAFDIRDVGLDRKF